MSVVPVVLSGGSGTRLWPLSRRSLPKQFHALSGNRSMFQETILRLDGIGGLVDPIIVANQEHRFLVAEQLREIGRAGRAILEPVGHNTAPAVTLAALEVSRADPKSTMIVLPSDHRVSDPLAFRAAVEAAVACAVGGKLVAFGVAPTHPETGYGYIKIGKPISENGLGFVLEGFVEKPTLELAQRYLESGDYLWNSGMFVFSAIAWLDAMRVHAPEMLGAVTDTFESVRRDENFLKLDAGSFEKCPSDSIDYAVMEKLTDGVVVKLSAGWSDVGSWDAFADCMAADASGNVVRGDVRLLSTTDSLVYSSSRLVATIGLNDAIVVETADAVLVTTKSNAQKVRDIVAGLESQSRSEHISHRAVRRPWGQYDCVSRGDRYQVKKITVKPGASLSLQKHYHRAEHWVVVRGTARVIRGDEEIILTENQSAYIPLGTVHQLENPGKVDLEIIEVQSGSYLGEDDIVRYKDRYGRV